MLSELKTNAVDHPRHYNAHPSGVECIDVVEWLGFNIGNAVKYLWRAGEKGNRVEDLRKAKWYVLRESTCSTTSHNPRVPSQVLGMARRFVESEPNSNIAAAVESLARYALHGSGGKMLGAALNLIDAEIAKTLGVEEAEAPDAE